MKVHAFCTDSLRLASLPEVTAYSAQTDIQALAVTLQCRSRQQLPGVCVKGVDPADYRMAAPQPQGLTGQLYCAIGA